MTTPEPAAEVRQTHIHGSVYGFVQGDHNTVTIVLNGEPRTVPFLAPPPAAHPFIGRDEVVAAVRERLLAGGTTALSALNGLPGVGKTALAVVLAHDPAMLSRYADGVLWAGLGRTPDVVASLAAWGAALGVAAQDVPAPAGVEEWARAVHAAIGLRRMLLVVDDAWTAEAALAFRLGGPNCARLLTTRVPEVAARFAGDAVCRISELEEADGLLLLEALAGTAEDERDAMRELVRLAGGLPLALTLMGGYLRVRTAGGRRERLRRAIEELGTARERLRLAQPQSPIERHPSLPLHVPLSLLAVLEVSAARLRPSARRTLTALGCFPSKPSTFSTAAALAVGGGTEDDLDELSDAGLVEASGADRHTLHQTVSDYARDGQPAEAEAAGLRLIRFFVAFLEGEVGGDPDGIDQELSNIREALRLAHEQGRREDLVRGMRAAFPLLEGRGLYKMAETHLRHSIAAARDLADPA
ncbi:NB-ARC domain-containing protein, partial [Planotetraspora sp. A-T 1434]|uniref:NB-ARC domain-containing protein n=1 Tax=Planotetraspora sp. A-T 1434 TaxID=2979219 RepID=UPI0021C1A4BF